MARLSQFITNSAEAQVSLVQLVLDSDNTAAAKMDFVDAGQALEGAVEDAEEAQDTVDTAEVIVENADELVDVKEMGRDDAQELVDMINEEIDGTEEFVENLDDRTVFALNRSLNNAVRTGLLPLDIDLDVLNRITDEDLGNGEIQQLTHAFETDARFERLAARFDAKADASGNDKFASHAERARNKGQERKNSFLDRIGDGGDDVGAMPVEEVTAAVSAAVADAANDAAADSASEQASTAVGAAAQEAAAEAAEATVGEIARELAKQKGNGGRR